MLQITMPLAAAGRQDERLPQFQPLATVEVAPGRDGDSVHITLSGVIFGESIPTLREFLKATSRFMGQHWTLQMQDLNVLSVRGTKLLVKFARILRARGHVLEVRGVHRNVHAALRAMRVQREFAWAD